MATFAPSNFALDAGDDKPHHEPPPPPLPHGPFAHQLNPPPTQPYSSATPKLSPRPSRDLRHHLSSGAMAGPNTHAPMAVPGGRINQPAHDHRPNLRDMGFAGPRSPPNNKSMYSLTYTSLSLSLSLHLPLAPSPLC